MTIIEELHKIQKQLKAKKNQYNSFGKYHYRSCEDIVEAVKPLLPSGVALIMTDEVVLIGDRVYVKADVSLSDGEGVVSAQGFAREPVAKKGMDESQITGTASSYARKYALNGLFAIDDAKDADTDEHHNATNRTVVKHRANPPDEKVQRIAEAMVKAIQDGDAVQLAKIAAHEDAKKNSAAVWKLLKPRQKADYKRLMSDNQEES